MTSITKYFATLVMVVALIGCQNDGSDDTTAQQSPQQTEQQQGQQPDQMGQMQQQQAPDVDVSDEEAGTFAEAAMSAQEIQMEAQKKMIGIIEEEGLEVETYQKIAQSQQMGQQGGQGGSSGDFSDEDMEKYESATAAMEEMQSDIQDDVTAAIEDAGMEMQRFQDISRAAQQDSALQMQIQEKIQEQMGGQMQQQQQQPPQN